MKNLPIDGERISVKLKYQTEGRSYLKTSAVMRGEHDMKIERNSVGSAELAYQIFGTGKVDVVIEMGLGASMAEWRRIAERLAESHTILLYERAGYGTSSVSRLERTPENIATELYQLLKQIEHTEKITILAHSQGGLYAWKFAKMYPKMVEKLVLLDPLSPEDYRFRMELTEEEFKKSGADKTQGLQMNLRLTRKHLGWMVRMLMRKAPPFYYYNEFLKEERKEILTMISRPQTYETALKEYEAAHDMFHLMGFLDRKNAPKIRIILITHDSDIARKEIREFGGASEEQAEKIEVLWQELMHAYLDCVSDGEWIQAKHSSHYIHLTDMDLVCNILRKDVDMVI